MGAKRLFGTILYVFFKPPLGLRIVYRIGALCPASELMLIRSVSVNLRFLSLYLPVRMWMGRPMLVVMRATDILSRSLLDLLRRQEAFGDNELLECFQPAFIIA